MIQMDDKPTTFGERIRFFLFVCLLNVCEDCERLPGLEKEYSASDQESARKQRDIFLSQTSPRNFSRNMFYSGSL